ncbi:unnamed protein product [Alopecurus aequalis]
MKILLALFFLSLVSGKQLDETPFDAAAYPVKWYRGGDAAPPASDVDFMSPPPAAYRGGDVAAPPASDTEVHVHNKPTLMVKTGVLFLKRNMFDGARLPANTKLGHAAQKNSLTSTTGPAPPPFSYSYLSDIVSFYNITPGSVRARQVAATLLLCSGTAQQEEEPHTCTTTEQAAVEFATAVLGATPRAARTVVHGRGEPLRYLVSPNGITVIGSAVVPCHPLPYPADVLYCHRPNGVQALRVTLVGLEDPSLGATAIAVCHEDTSGWDGEYFLMLNGSRGEPICHYMPENYILWVANTG